MPDLSSCHRADIALRCGTGAAVRLARDRPLGEWAAPFDIHRRVADCQFREARQSSASGLSPDSPPPRASEPLRLLGALRLMSANVAANCASV
jgi:hypothetical protein